MGIEKQEYISKLCLKDIFCTEHLIVIIIDIKIFLHVIYRNINVPE